MTGLAELRDSLSAELHAGDRADLAAVPGDLRTDARGDAIRVVVCGETKRGKSTLVNSLVGRPLLSPVGVDVTTACWLELRYGDRDEAHAVLADPRSLGAPRRVPIDVREVARYAAVQEVADPVLGVEVRVNSPLLRDIVLVDTPGVGFELGTEVRALREQRGWSQTELASRAGMTQSAMARFEAGGTVPTLPVLERIAVALEMRLSVELVPSR